VTQRLAFQRGEHVIAVANLLRLTLSPASQAVNIGLRYPQGTILGTFALPDHQLAGGEIDVALLERCDLH